MPRPGIGGSQLHELTRAALSLRLVAVFIALLCPFGRNLSILQITAVVAIVVLSIFEVRSPESLSLLEAHPLLTLVDLTVVVGFVVVAGAAGALQLTVLTTAFLVGVWVDRVGGLVTMVLLLVLYFLGWRTRSGQDGSTGLIMSFMLMAMWFLGLVVRKAADNEQRSHKVLQASIIATTAAEERAKLATELHDKLAKTIQSVALTTSVIPDAVESDPSRAIMVAKQAHQMSAQAVSEPRCVMSGLREDSTELVFGEAVIGLVSAWQCAEDRHVRLSIDKDMVLERQDVQFEVLAAISEALDNIAQHAGPCDVSVVASKEGPTLSVVVRDTGKGFSEPELRACQRAGHQGVLDIQRRLLRVGGRAEVSSEVGEGTTVTMVVQDKLWEERE